MVTPDPPKPAFVEEAERLADKLQQSSAFPGLTAGRSAAVTLIATALQAAAQAGERLMESATHEALTRANRRSVEIATLKHELAEARAAVQKAHSAAADALMVFEQRAQKAEQDAAATSERAIKDWADRENRLRGMAEELDQAREWLANAQQERDDAFAAAERHRETKDMHKERAEQVRENEVLPLLRRAEAAEERARQAAAEEQRIADMLVEYLGQTNVVRAAAVRPKMREWLRARGERAKGD